MRNSILILFVCLFFKCINAQKINKTIEYKPNKFMLLGKVNKNGFKHDDFSWFKTNYKNYLSNDKIIRKLKDSLKNYKIKAFFGSWCGDSKKNLPIFYKVLDEANFPKKNLEVIALDSKKEAYKQSPNNEEKGLNIHRVPAFIFYKNGKEINRIVEHPKETIERDILKIVTGKKYQPRYKAVTLLEKLFNEKSMDSLQLMKKRLARYLPDITKNPYELNTYGNVKWRANNLEKAKFIFKLNTEMYPLNYYIVKTLGDFEFEQKNHKKALHLYYKSLSLYPNAENVKERITEIEKIINKK